MQIMIDVASIRSTISSWIASYDPATDAEINELVDAASISLSPAYLTLLRATNGGETFVVDSDSDDAFYLVLWHSADVITCNDDFEVTSKAPDHFAIGTNGSGELLAFDRRRNDEALYMLPAIGLTGDAAILVAPSFDQILLKLVGRSG